MVKKEVTKDGKKLFTIALVCVVALAIFTTIYRIWEIMLFKGTEGYSLPYNVSGMLSLLALLTLFYIVLLKRWKWGFWYGFVLSAVLFLSYLFKSPFVWPYAVNVVLSLALIIILVISRKRFGK
ncbi:MAG: hypothetical protein AABY40_02380 [Nanoarchaeota archaeon]